MDRALVFFGWCVRVFISGGSLKSNGVILNDIVNKLESTNSIVGWAFSLQLGLCYITCPLASLLLHVFTRRQLAVMGSFFAGASYIYCGLFLHSVWQLFFAIAASGIGMGFHLCAGYLTFCECFYTNFGTAYSLSSLFYYFGLATFPLLLQYLKEVFGFHQGLILFGALLWNSSVSAFALTNPLSNLRIQKSLPTESNKDEGECRYVKILTEDGSLTGGNGGHNFQRYVQSLWEIFEHENFAIFIILQGLVSYIYVSWGLFLVSAGSSAGLDPVEAVLLSYAGGIGGFAGKVTATGLFQIRKMDANTSSTIPLLCNVLCLMGFSLAKTFHTLLVLTFFIGFSIGLQTSGLAGLLPSLMCTHHFQSAFVASSVIDGIAIQLAGFVSGLINDVFGSALYVFAFNALLSMAGIPFALFWAYKSRPVSGREE